MTDTTKQNILMCEKAYEIQNLWKPKVGDFYDSRGNSQIKGVKVLQSLAGGKFRILLYNKNIRSIHRHIWLPRQDQYQKMVYEDIVQNCQKTTHWELKDYYFEMLTDAFKLRKWYIQDQCYDYDHINSMEQLWLAFVMMEKFNKEWDGEEWINQTRSYDWDTRRS